MFCCLLLRSVLKIVNQINILCQDGYQRVKFTPSWLVQPVLSTYQYEILSKPPVVLARIARIDVATSAS